MPPKADIKADDDSEFSSAPKSPSWNPPEAEDEDDLQESAFSDKNLLIIMSHKVTGMKRTLLGMNKSLADLTKSLADMTDLVDDMEREVKIMKIKLLEAEAAEELGAPQCEEALLPEHVMGQREP